MSQDFFRKTLHQWRILFKDSAYRWSFALGLFVLISGGLVTKEVGVYRDMSVYVSVGDFILNRIPTYDLEILFFWGLYALIGMIVFYGILVEPEKFPFMMKTFGVLLFVRSGFIVLTFIGPPEGFFFKDGVNFGVFWKDVIFKNDLFFSGHTSIPFMGYLLFRKNKWFRMVMLLGSVVMGLTVLLMHVHYSIDVFAAFFISYGIYAFSDKIFNQLNLRFKRRIALHGWNTWKKRIESLKKSKHYKNFQKIFYK
ncbi:MAG: phosphatase PAP2-related protein [Candidatus Gracilibacteria bacterium]|nr:phosphatase PAP2-related protein [Candidatus Gracilibacteria bacterium]